LGARQATAGRDSRGPLRVGQVTALPACARGSGQALPGRGQGGGRAAVGHARGGVGRRAPRSSEELPKEAKARRSSPLPSAARMKTFGRRMAALCAFFVVAAAAAGCGSSVPGNSVAAVAGNPITLKAFHHWLYVAAKS